MSNSVDKCKANETTTCCCVDITEFIDNRDCNVSYESEYNTEQEAKDVLANFIEVARTIESDPCVVDYEIEQMEGGVKLFINFNFSCAAERIIFELKLR